MFVAFRRVSKMGEQHSTKNDDSRVREREKGRKEAITMINSDPHMGNFFIRKEGTIGTFDFQVLSEEHPIRDVRHSLIE